MKNLTTKFQPTVDTIKDEEGKIQQDGPDIKNRWKLFCEDLYKRNDNISSEVPNTSYENVELEPSPLYSEIEKAIKEMKSNKSPGIDDIPIELMKEGGENVTRFFHRLITIIWETKDWLKDWSKSIFLPIPKNGDSMECTNNRTISLVSQCSKILLKIIAGLMKGKMEEEISEEECGFVRGKGTRDQILNLKLTIEKNGERKKNLYLCFIDYRKAFDIVAHEVLWKNMIDMGFPKHIILLIKTLYKNQKATFKTSYDLADFFQIGQGVRQGCILSPSPFNILSEQIMRTALDDFDGNITIGGRKITNLRYADDIVLVAGSMNELKELTKKVHVASNKSGLHLNPRK